MKSTSNQMLRLLFWESTIKCNLSCAHCRRLESDDAAVSDMSTEQAKGLIEQLASVGRKQPFMPILVFSGGEPLCRDDLFELIAEAEKANIPTALATNGTLIDSKIAGQIANSGIARVSVSLDGATAGVHDELRQLEGSFEKALEGLKNLSQKQVPFQINVTLTKNNAHQLEDVYNLAKSIGAVAVHIFMLVPVGCGQTLAETDMLSAEQYEEKLIEISRLDDLGQMQVKVTCGPHYERVVRQEGLYAKRKKMNIDDGTSIKKEHGKSGKGCLAGLGVLFVSHKGEVFPCGYLPVNCGNILEEKLEDIWLNNEDLAQMRDPNLLEGKCGICGYRAVCGGCRGRAYGLTGNYMAEEPFCAFIPPEATG